MAKRVLAIDDSQLIRNIVTQTLETGGYEVATAENGELGIKAFNAGQFDMIVTDINMPIMDGITLIEEIRKINDDIPILVLSTESDGEMLNAGNVAGADGWVVKPINPQQFIDLVDQVLAAESV